MITVTLINTKIKNAGVNMQIKDRNFAGGNYLGGNFPRENSPEGSLIGRSFPSGSFPDAKQNVTKAKCLISFRILEKYRIQRNLKSFFYVREKVFKVDFMEVYLCLKCKKKI